jgi:TetR/AcrR family transcriptional repressor of nem operon
MEDVIDVNRQASARSRIVEAATILFWREGYHPVSTDAICRAASVTKGSLYHAFPSKAEVLAASLERVWTADWAEIQRIYARPGTPEVKFRAHLEWFAKSQKRLRAQHGLVLGTFDMAIGVSIPDSVQAAIQAHQGEHFARLEASIAGVLDRPAGQDSYGTWLAEIVQQLLAGTMIRARLTNDLSPLEKVPETVFRLIRATSAPSQP